MPVHIQDLLLVDRLEQRKADTLRANLTFGVEVLAQLLTCFLACHIRIHWSSSSQSSAGT